MIAILSDKIFMCICEGKTFQDVLNMSYLTDSYMESATKYIIFGLNMMVKSGLEKFISKSLHARRWLLLLCTEFGIWGTFT